MAFIPSLMPPKTSKALVLPRGMAVAFWKAYGLFWKHYAIWDCSAALSMESLFAAH